ncbi:MAG: DMT family transporter [Candidatus Obscuribacterales bacterium]|nr:DMT family transporter [Steroidobacteraceae bacterium]
MQSQNFKGIIAILIAVIAFSVMDAAMKFLGQSYSPLQVTTLRGWASLPFIVLLVALTNRWHELKPTRWGMHILRGVLAIAMLVLFIYSVRTLSLSSSYAIFLCAPLLVTALSVLILREHVDWQRWIAIAVGLVGVVAMLRPAANEVISLGALAALAAAICYAFAAIMIRTLSRTETTLSISFSFLLVIAFIAGTLAWPNWTPVQMAHWPWIATLGFAGAIGQYFIIEAFRHAPASVVAPFDYTALVWGALLDWLLWNTLPESRTLIGGTIVAAGGLYLIYRERVTATR